MSALNPPTLRAAVWQLGSRTIAFERIPRLMGIVNVTPDSFSDGGRFLGRNAAVEHALQLAADGADLLDIGGESTRPYAQAVAIQEELDRVVPVVKEIRRRVDVPISIDTSKAAVARAAVEVGAEVINDVTGLAGDPDMISVALESGAGVCAMHMQGTPQTMQDDPRYGDVVGEIAEYLIERRNVLQAAGIELRRICLDPGIGFGKTHEHNIELMAHCRRFVELGSPILVGHSRKGFLGKLIGDNQADRDAATAGAALAAASQGVQILRVHNVRLVREALLAFEACGGVERIGMGAGSNVP
jgi:dihydropteroate synthase